MSQASIELVPFYFDQIEAIRDGEGRGFAVVKRICENIGVDFSRQLRNLKTTHAHWSTMDIMTTVGEDGKPHEVAVIPIDKIPMWLVQIKPTKVAPEIREKLRLYQIEAADVLARWALGKNARKPSGSGSSLPC